MDGAESDTAGTPSGCEDARPGGNKEPGIEPALYTNEAGFTVMKLDLAERESVFVGLPPRCGSARCGSPRLRPRQSCMTLSTPWTLTFPADSARRRACRWRSWCRGPTTLMWPPSTSLEQRPTPRRCRCRRRGCGRDSGVDRSWEGADIAEVKVEWQVRGKRVGRPVAWTHPLV